MMGAGCDPRPHRAGIRRQRPATIRCDRLAGRAARRPRKIMCAPRRGGPKLSAAFSGRVDHAWTVPGGLCSAPLRSAPGAAGTWPARAESGSACEPPRSPPQVRRICFFLPMALPHRLLAAARPALPAGLDRCHAARTRRAALGFGETCRFTRAGGGVPWRAGSVSLSGCPMKTLDRRVVRGEPAAREGRKIQSCLVVSGFWASY